MSDNVSFAVEVADTPTIEQRVLAGEVDTNDGALELPAPDVPYKVAQHVRRALYTDAQGRALLLYWRGNWWHYTGASWEKHAEQGRDADLPIRADMFALFDTAVFSKVSKDVVTLVPWKPNSAKVSNAVDALKALANNVHDDKANAPAFIDSSACLPGAPGEYVSLSNGLFRLKTRELMPHTPALFNTYTLPYAYTPGAQCENWQRFLADVFEHDLKGVNLLQEYMGYVISGRTDMHKALLLVGPPRAGKGVILRTLTALVGAVNVATPSLDGLGTDPGQAELIGKPLAVVGDAREASRANGRKSTELILNVVGEDSVSIQRKYQTNWTGRLPTRFVLASNELPRFVDASGAVVTRFMSVRVKKSFLGREDSTLEDRLMAELPGIFNWALQGLDRLNETGRFTVPNTMAKMTEGLEGLASPAIRFMQDVLEVTGNPEDIVLRTEVHRAWKRWHEDNGTRAASAEQMVNQLCAADGRVSEQTLPNPWAAHKPGRVREPRARFVVGVKLDLQDYF